MLVSGIEIRSFRNIERAEAHLHPDLTLVSGGNGEGKTNLLEAVYVLANLRSWRTHRLTATIKKGCEIARLSGTFEPGGESIASAQVVIDGGRTDYRLNGARPERMDDYLGTLVCERSGPEDAQLVTGPPNLRRALIDRACFFLDGRHLGRYRTYERVLKGRNALLRRGGTDESLLDFYDRRLAEAAGPLKAGRRAMVEALSSEAGQVFRQIWGEGGENFEIVYRDGLAGIDDPDGIAGELRRIRPREIQNGCTLKGPHTDDLVLRHAGLDLRTYGSQGQRRIAVISVRLAGLRLFRTATGRRALLLLDDLFSDIDTRRSAATVTLVREAGLQCLCTTTRADEGPLPGSRGHIRIRQGSIVET